MIPGVEVREVQTCLEKTSTWSGAREVRPQLPKMQIYIFLVTHMLKIFGQSYSHPIFFDTTRIFALLKDNICLHCDQNIWKREELDIL